MSKVHSPALRNFYLIQLAIWMWTAFSCKWLEERRKDYLEMMAHHVITVALVSNSYVENQVRHYSPTDVFWRACCLALLYTHFSR